LTHYINGQPYTPEKPLPRAREEWKGRVLKRGNKRYICIKSKKAGYGWIEFKR